MLTEKEAEVLAQEFRENVHTIDLFGFDYNVTDVDVTETNPLDEEENVCLLQVDAFFDADDTSYGISVSAELLFTEETARDIITVAKTQALLEKERQLKEHKNAH